MKKEVAIARTTTAAEEKAASLTASFTLLILEKGRRVGFCLGNLRGI
jgi:hypothetical protein